MSASKDISAKNQSEQSAVERHGALEVVANHRDVMDALYLDFFSERLCARRAHRAPRIDVARRAASVARVAVVAGGQGGARVRTHA